MDETQNSRLAEPRLVGRRDDAEAFATSPSPETSFAAPTSISSPLATASLCAESRHASIRALAALQLTIQ